MTYKIIKPRDRRLDKQILRTDELRPNIITHNLDSISRQDTVPGRRIKGVEDEDKRDDCGTGIFHPVGDVQGAAYRPGQEAAEEHAGQGGKEHGAAAESVDYVGAPEGPAHVPHREATIDDRLVSRVGDANTAQDQDKAVDHG